MMTTRVLKVTYITYIIYMLYMYVWYQGATYGRVDGHRHDAGKEAAHKGQDKLGARGVQQYGTITHGHANLVL